MTVRHMHTRWWHSQYYWHSQVLWTFKCGRETFLDISVALDFWICESPFTILGFWNETSRNAVFLFWCVIVLQTTFVLTNKIVTAYFLTTGYSPDTYILLNFLCFQDESYFKLSFLSGHFPTLTFVLCQGIVWENDRWLRQIHARGHS